MTKLLLIALAVAVLVWLLFGRRSRDRPPRKKNSPSDSGTEDMVVCARCGVHLPRSEALSARGLHYCSSAHRDQVPPT
jgi:uncharacterized protein